MSGEHNGDASLDHQLLDTVLENVLARVHIHCRERRVENSNSALRVASTSQRNALLLAT